MSDSNVNNTQNDNNNKSWILWDRYAKITFTTKDEKKIIFERFNDDSISPDFSFELDYDITESSNIAKIVIWNLTDEMAKTLKIGTEVVIEAGYLNDEVNKQVGVVYKGIIESTKGTWENDIDKKYEITCNTYNDEYKDTKINLKAGKDTSVSTIINLILSKLDKLKAGKIKLGKDLKYKDGKTLHNNVKSIFKQLAKDTDSVFFISNGVVSFFPQKEINRGAIKFDKNLFQSVDVNDETYTLRCVFNHELQEGFRLNIDLSEEFTGITLKGEYLIMKGKSQFNFNGDSYTELEITTKLEEDENKKEKEIEIVTNKKGKNKKSSKKKDKKDKKDNKKSSKKSSKKAKKSEKKRWSWQ